jgi:hypothetical protein
MKNKLRTFFEGVRLENVWESSLPGEGTPELRTAIAAASPLPLEEGQG